MTITQPCPPSKPVDVQKLVAEMRAIIRDGDAHGRSAVHSTTILTRCLMEQAANLLQAPASGWQPFDPPSMQDLGWYIVEYADGSVGFDTWDDGDWQEIDAKVAFVYLMPPRKAEGPSAGGEQGIAGIGDGDKT